MSKLPAIAFSKSAADDKGTLVFLVGEKGRLPASANDHNKDGRISNALSVAEFDGAFGAKVEIIAPTKGIDRILVVGLGKMDEIDEDGWHTFGLQGTGSHDIIVDDAFIPEYRTHRSIDGFLCQNPGQEVNTGPLYSLPWAQVFTRSVSTAAFGGAQAAINAGLAIMQDRVSTNTGKASKQDPILHAALARAISEKQEMETTLRLTFDELMGYAERGEAIPMEKRAFFTYQSSTVVRRLARLIDDVVQLFGGRAIYMTSEIIQPWLDLHAGRAHVANDPNNRTGDAIGTMLGEQPLNPFL